METTSGRPMLETTQSLEPNPILSTDVLLQFLFPMSGARESSSVLPRQVGSTPCWVRRRSFRSRGRPWPSGMWVQGMRKAPQDVQRRAEMCEVPSLRRFWFWDVEAGASTSKTQRIRVGIGGVWEGGSHGFTWFHKLTLLPGLLVLRHHPTGQTVFAICEPTISGRNPKEDIKTICIKCLNEESVGIFSRSGGCS